MIYTGHPARIYRLMIYGEDDTGCREILKEELKEILTRAETDSFSFENIENQYDPFRVTCHAAYAAVETQGDRILFKSGRYLSSCENPFIDKKRKNDILLPYAYTMVDSATFILPAGWTVEALPADTVIDNPVGSYKTHFVSDGNKISVIRDFTLKKAFCPKTQYLYIRQLFDLRKEITDKIIVLKAV